MYIYNILLYIPRAPMTSILEGQPPKTRPFPIKTRVIWVLGIYNGLNHLESKAPQSVFALLQMHLSRRSFQRVASQAAPCHDWVTTWRPWVGGLICPCRIHPFGWHGEFLYCRCRLLQEFLPPLYRQIVFFPN